MQEIIEEAPARTPKKKSSTAFPIAAFFKSCMRNWYWFVISLIACCSLAYLYTKTQPQRYQASALILIKTKDSAQGTQSQAFSDMGIKTGMNYLPNEMFKLRSTKLMESVVNSLNLNVQYYGHVFLRDVNIYKSSPIEVVPLREITSSYTLTVVPKGGNEFEFKEDGEGGWKRAKFGNKLNTSHGPVTITKSPTMGDGYEDFKVIVKVNTTKSVARAMVANLSVALANKTSDVTNLVLTGDNAEMCRNALDALIIAYNQDAINDKNMVARSTEAFIADRIEALSKDLSGVDSQVAALKVSAANNAMYADPSTSLRYAEGSADVDMQISLASYIRDYLTGMSGHQLIPSNTGIANTGIEEQIGQYNEQVLKYQKIAGTSSAENPVMVELNHTLTSIKSSIMAGLNNYIKSLSMKQSQARSQARVATGSMVAVPSQEKAITEVTRQQKIKEQLYLYLLNKREENALQLAITEPNAKVIESASGSSTPIYPMPQRNMLIGLLAGLLIPAGILYGIFWYYSLDTMVHTRRDIEEVCSLPVLGELPNKKNKGANHEIVITENGRDNLSEAFRIVRSNLIYLIDKRNFEGTVIQFTSTMSGEGKSFCAANLALACAHDGKRVVALDLDLRKGRFSQYLGVNDHHDGVSAYLAGKIDDVKSMIHNSGLHENLDVISVGAIPPNPTGLLSSSRLKNLLAELKKEYDYVILDTVPYTIIADAGIINRNVDLTIYIVRDNKVDKRYFEELEQMSNEGKINNLTILINDIKIDKKRYGYGGYGYGSYGYGYGGYGYGYTSDYYKDQNDEQ